MVDRLRVLLVALAALAVIALPRLALACTECEDPRAAVDPGAWLHLAVVLAPLVLLSSAIVRSGRHAKRPAGVPDVLVEERQLPDRQADRQPDRRAVAAHVGG